MNTEKAAKAHKHNVISTAYSTSKADKAAENECELRLCSILEVYLPLSRS